MAVFANEHKSTNGFYFFNRTNASEKYNTSTNTSSDNNIYNSVFDLAQLQETSFTFQQIERALSVCGFVLNVSAIVNLLSFKGSLKTQFKLVLSLAISHCLIDFFLFISTFYKFQDLFNLHPHLNLWYTQSIVTLLISLLYVTAQYSGLGTMCAIAVDVLIRVKKPLRYAILMSKFRGTVIITCLWLIPAVLILTTAFIVVYYYNLSYVYMSAIFVLFSVIYCVLCLIFLFIFIIIYVLIYCTVRNLKNNALYTGRSRSNTKMAVTFFLIILTYFICIIPDITIIILPILAIKGLIIDYFLAINCVSILFILNTVIDPVLYIVRIPEIQRRYCICLQRLRQCPNFRKGVSTEVHTSESIVDVN